MMVLMSDQSRVMLIVDNYFSHFSRLCEQIHVLEILGTLFASIRYVRGNVHPDRGIDIHSILENSPAFAGEKEPVRWHRKVRTPLPPLFWSRGVEIISSFRIPQVHHSCVAVDRYSIYEILYFRMAVRPAAMGNANGFDKE